ncbi:MAG: ABC transporter permease [Flavobacteriaceae bacterium]|nr:ABC transporter permease [Flavobacteriaceae bacterium]
MQSGKEDWLFEIKPKEKLFRLNLKEIWYYRDLLFLFVKRDIVTVYKQTILGPLWYFIQPIFTSVVFTLVFNNIANIETGNVPPFLFNLAGITAWNYFKECLTQTSGTFVKNQSIFGKVYFPRAIMPMSTTISNLFKFGIQLLIFICFYVYFAAFAGATVRPSLWLFLVPLLVLCMALMGLGLGMLFSSLTSKYRDISVLITFGVQLLMYASAVMYPVSIVREKQPGISWLVEWNPITQIIEGFRYATLSEGSASLSMLAYTCTVSIVLFLLGLVVFNKTERSFIDTV